ncbi:MAG TPA: glycosyl transferase family 4 [Rhodanobacteraceae bacterium]|nr:glycosyl transferase family 4 [Rhodanobacteraceae bacterium]
MNAGAALLCVLAFALAALLAWSAIAYAHRRGLLDTPGRRRSHELPTPRGGGIGIVAGALACAVPALLYWPGGVSSRLVAAFAAAALLVAATGWWDDHRALPVLPRLLAQLVAAVAFVAVLVGDTTLGAWWLPPLVVLAAWSINLHNFMDGIDGLLGAQALFTGAAFAVIAGVAGQPALALACAGLAAACAGFLLFNWPPARIFMGDVGSGFVGALVFMLAALLCVRAPALAWPLLIVCSAFVVDAGLTLAWRMLRGRRWYTAHREHLYQYLVRRGWTHARTGCLYMLWNLLLAVPFAWMAMRQPALAPLLCATLYVLAAVLWWRGRRACMRRPHRMRRTSHA